MTELTDALLDDIWECAAEFHGDASYKAEMYEKYTERQHRHLTDKATAERVMDWVKAVRREREIDD